MKESENIDKKRELLSKESIPHSIERKESVKPKEDSEQEKMITASLKREIELMNLEGDLNKESEVKAKKIQYLSEKEKIENLIEMAQKKGVVFAVKTAQSMNDPYILDTLHDILAKEGYYKEFEK